MSSFSPQLHIFYIQTDEREKKNTLILNWNKKKPFVSVETKKKAAAVATTTLCDILIYVAKKKKRTATVEEEEEEELFGIWYQIAFYWPMKMQVQHCFLKGKWEKMKKFIHITPENVNTAYIMLHCFVCCFVSICVSVDTFVF